LASADGMTAERCIEVRKAQGLGRGQLGKLANVNRETIRSFESGRAIAEPLRLRIATALGLDTATGGE
jgi:DNA-binding XRE family transcriptional regulator